LLRRVGPRNDGESKDVSVSYDNDEARSAASPTGWGPPAATGGVLVSYVGGRRGRHPPVRLDG